MKRLIFTLSLVLLPLLATAQLSQPTGSQHAKLMRQRDRVLKTQRRILDLHAEQISESAKWQTLCAKFALEDHWPAGTVCDISTAAFYEKPAQRQPPLPTPAKPIPNFPRGNPGDQPAKDEPAKPETDSK